MTADPASLRPPYNTAAPAEWEPVSPPPYDFLGVTMRVFPLLADLRQLDRFCDSYLNLVPREIAFFRPSVPLVLLVLVDYGKMVSKVRQIGWVSQRETAFIVPLAWMREVDGEEVFVDWASVAPYIFVDEAMSVATGREVYGWPKERGWFEPGIDTWTDVRETEPFRFRLSTQVHPHLPPNPGEGIQELYTIRETKPPSPFAWPPSVESLLNPFHTASNLLRASESLISAATGMWTSALRAGPGSWTASGRTAIEMLGAVWPLADTSQLPNPVSNTINLKQFRDADDPRLLSYQALTNARMTGLRYGRASLMGYGALAGGDPSGGYQVEIRSWSAYPIVHHLGLLTRPVQSDVDVLRPLFPFEIELDLRYEAGEILAWRSKHYDWSQSEKPGRPTAEPPLYNITLGKHEAPLPGSFRFRDVTARLLTLRAEVSVLQGLVDELINDPYEETLGERPFRATLPWVLCSATYFCSPPVEGPANCWRDRELAFHVPLERTGRDGEIEIWFVTPVIYCNDEVAVVTLREVTGLPASSGAVLDPPVEWISSGPPGVRYLTHVQSQVATAPTADIAQSQQVVASILVDPEMAALGSKPNAAAKKSHQSLVEQVRTGNVQRRVTLKQFRDVHDPTRACFQAVVEQTVRLEVTEHAPITDPLVLHIHSFPTSPIVQVLGLEVVRRVPPTPGAHMPPTDVVVPYERFWIRGSLEYTTDLNRNVFPPPPASSGAKE